MRWKTLTRALNAAAAARLFFGGFLGSLAVCVPAAAQGIGYYWTNPPSFYNQGPRGEYESPSDFSRSVYGVPCDYECTLRAQQRWGAVPAHPHRAYFFPDWED